MKILTTILFFFGFIIASINGQGVLDYQLEENISYYTEDQIETEYQQSRCKLDLYYPTGLDSFATIVWFHGGGLRAGAKFIPDQLKQQGVAVVAANYRLYPKVNNPVYTKDAAAAVAWVFDKIEEYGGDRTKIFVSGHSAGGYLASMVGLDPSYLDDHNISADEIAGLIPFSGHAITHFTIREERGIDGKKVIVDEFAPLRHIRKEAPPYIIVTGDRDQELLGRYEENAYMWRMMKEVGHPDCKLFELDGFNHGQMDDPAYYLLLKEVKRIMKK